MKKIHKGKILNIQNTALDTCEIKIDSNLDTAVPGQFISILCPKKTLRRPFSIRGFDKGVITVIFKVKGEGTNYIKSLKPGDEVDFLGAMGKGFDIENKKSLLVGAGIGIAPMLFLKDFLDKKGIENYLISGFKAQNEVITGSDKVVIGGSVLDELPGLIEEYKPGVIYSCGPEIVLKNIAKLGEQYGIETQIAMEKVMACSIGVCRGCVIKIFRAGKIQNAAICHDGPVFKGDEVVWE